MSDSGTLGNRCRAFNLLKSRSYTTFRVGNVLVRLQVCLALLLRPAPVAELGMSVLTIIMHFTCFQNHAKTMHPTRTRHARHLACIHPQASTHAFITQASDMHQSCRHLTCIHYAGKPNYFGIYGGDHHHSYFVVCWSLQLHVILFRLPGLSAHAGAPQLCCTQFALHMHSALCS